MNLIKLSGFQEFGALTNSLVKMDKTIKNNMDKIINQDIQLFNKNLKLEDELLKKQEERLQSEKLITIGDLSTRLAHDLKNPLTIIQMSLENMRVLNPPNEKNQRVFDKIDRSIQRMSHQIDDVLNYIKGDPVVMERIQFSELLHDAIDSLDIPDRINLIFPKNDVSFICDQKQFSIVMNNLILNSIQSIGDKGEIKITIEDKFDEIIIQVKDSGKGMTNDILQKVFEPMYTTKQRGTGLGLVSVKSIIKLHGGEISVTSPPTVFTITLPTRID